MIVMAILLLGVLFASPAAAEFCDGNYVVDAGNWSTVEITDGGAVHRASYNWKESRSNNYNRARMDNPTRHGMPEDTILHSAPSMRYTRGGGTYSYIRWVAVYDAHYTFTVMHNGVVYTNDTSAISYQAVWIERPCRHMSDMNKYVDKVTAEPVADGIKFCVDQHWTDSDRDKHRSYGEKVIPTGIENVQIWVQQNNMSIRAKLTNSSMGYYILGVNLPSNILGYRVEAVGDTHSAFYEQHSHMMQRNVTGSGKEFFEVVKAPNTDSLGMSSYGANKFIIPYDTNYTVDVLVYTPFEQIQKDVLIAYEEREVIVPDKRSAWESFVFLVTMTFGAYVLLRGCS